MKDLQKNGVPVYLISGGFRRIIEPVAQELGISKENIFSNHLFFNNQGKYKLLLGSMMGKASNSGSFRLHLRQSSSKCSMYCRCTWVVTTPTWSAFPVGT